MKETRKTHRIDTHRIGKNAPTDDAAALGDAVLRRAINGKFVTGIDIPAHGLQGRPIPASAGAAVLEQLSGALGDVTATGHPRTFKLLHSGRRRLARKLIEEACEVTVEAVKRDADGVVRESADLLYHLVVLWFHLGIEPNEIWDEMRARATALGIAEKLPKPRGRDSTSADLDH
jgi:phosphoribosyl-ATP pyrophosphohydrolase